MNWFQLLTLVRFSLLDLGIIILVLILGYCLALFAASRARVVKTEAPTRKAKPDQESDKAMEDYVSDAFDLESRPEAIPTMRERI